MLLYCSTSYSWLCNALLDFYLIAEKNLKLAMSHHTPTQAVVGQQGVNFPIADRWIALFPGPRIRPGNEAR